MDFVGLIIYFFLFPLVFHGEVRGEAEVSWAALPASGPGAQAHLPAHGGQYIISWMSREKNFVDKNCYVFLSVAGPGSGAFLTPRSGIRIRDGDPGYVMNIPHHFSESLETVSRFKNT
jgi:hypothetical protein